MLDIAQVQADQIGLVRELFLEYARSLGFSLCFQGFDQEMESLPGDYVPPGGRLFLATVPATDPQAQSSLAQDPLARESLGGGVAAGCVAVRRLGEDTCEMKRLYVRHAFRGRHLGRSLATAAILAGRESGYRRMRLDTIPAEMRAAVSLYRELGFRDIPPYYGNPIPGALCMELML